MITKEALAEFQILYLKEYGIRLDSQETEELGNRLINMVKAVCGRSLSKLIFDKGVRKDPK